MKNAFRSVAILLSVGVLLAVVFCQAPLSQSQEPASKPSETAVKRTRKMVMMLDDIYKTTIVMVTKKYVQNENDYPAGRFGKRLFEAISKKGTHQVRLIDVSGKPYNDKNVAVSDFEKEGVRHIKAGKEYFEKIVAENNEHYLHAITPVPVVLQKCILCHSHYKDVKPGAAVGAITYKAPIE